MSGFGAGGRDYMFGDEFDDEGSKMMYRDMDDGNLYDEEDYYDDEDLYGEEMSATSSQLQEEAYVRS